MARKHGIKDQLEDEKARVADSSVQSSSISREAPQRAASMASDECKRSEGVTWNRTAKKYQIQLSIGDAPQLKLGRYDDLEEANARVAPFNELKNKLRSQRMPNRQIYDVLKKLRDGDAGVRSAVVAMPTVLLA